MKDDVGNLQASATFTLFKTRAETLCFGDKVLNTQPLVIKLLSM